MRHATLLFAAFIAAAPAWAAEATPEDAVEAFHRALAEGARERALELLAPDAVIFEAGEAETSRDEYAKEHLPADMEFSKATARKVVDRRSGVAGDAAWVLTRTTTTGTFRGKEIKSRGNETMVLKRGASGWRIVHIHWSSAKMP